MNRLLTLLILVCCARLVLAAGAVSFSITKSQMNGPLTEIVVQYDANAKTGYTWDQKQPLTWYASNPADLVRRGAEYIREGVKRMTGQELPIVNRADLSKGIVLTLFANASQELRKDPEVIDALKNTGKDSYNDKEAFFIRSEGKRLLIIANTIDGLLDAIPAMMEPLGYEVLGMGPDWIYAPDYHNKPLTITINKPGRPGYYSRMLVATSGQDYGCGTIFEQKLADPADENVDASYWRWRIGMRILGKSMPPFPGHSLQAYHRAVVAKMKETHTTDGFLVPKATLGPDANRPAADAGNAGQLWINDDADGKPGAGKVYLSDGKKWGQCDLEELGVNLDLSVPLVQQVILERMKKQAEANFTSNPDDVVVLCNEPEDGGGYGALGKLMKNQNWYPDYCKAEGLPFGRPYVLSGYLGLDHPVETWDPDLAADTVFGFDNWLLHEMDKWIDAMPEKDRVTTTGKKKKELLRDSGYSYNYHDVPPDFNLDPRIRLMIASYPKHRGAGKWKIFASQQDLAKAFQVMLPREPSGDYRIISLSYYLDPGTGNIPPGWSGSPASLQKDLRESYAAGFKAIQCETDFNFGKYGLAYYLYARLLWSPNMSVFDVDALRDRWLHRAYGSAWKEMKAYYDYMLPENYPVNGPHSWGQAIRLIDAASRAIDGTREPDVQRRIDDLKQFWYYYYLCDTGQEKADSPAFKELFWKGQMSYMTATHVFRRIFNTEQVVAVVSPAMRQGPAHYTHDETQAWWQKILDHWPYTPVTMFADTTLVNGQKGKTVDLNDLVMVKELKGGGFVDDFFSYNSGYMKPAKFYTIALNAGDPIGFKLSWPFNPADGYYRQKDVAYGMSYWNTKTKKWDIIADYAKTVQRSEESTNGQGAKIQECVVNIKAPKAGTYRFDVGYGGNGSPLSSLGFDIKTGKYASQPPFTFFLMQEGHTQSPLYIYIPKGAKTLDLEVWDGFNGKYITLYNGLPGKNLKVSRDMNTDKTLDVSKVGTYVIPLKPGEDGSIARISGNGLGFPCMYSVPSLWAKSPGVLLIPRAIAIADGLTIIEK